VTSSAEVVDLNGNIFGRTICPLSFVVIALIFSEFRGGAESPPPVPQDQKKPSLNRVKFLKKAKTFNVKGSKRAASFG